MLSIVVARDIGEQIAPRGSAPGTSQLVNRLQAFVLGEGSAQTWAVKWRATIAFLTGGRKAAAAAT